MSGPDNYLLALAENLRRALKQRKPDEARRILARLKEQAPANVVTRAMDLEILISEGSIDEALRLSQELTQLYPESPRILFLAGKAAYLRKKYDEAIRLFRESLSVNRHWRTTRWLAKSLTQTGKYEEAEQLLVPLARDRPACADDLSWLYERMGEHERARTLIERRHHATKKSQSQLLRLQAASLPPAELIEEMEELLDLGEAIPPVVLPLFIAALIDTGKAQRARELAQEQLETLDPSTANSLAWAFHTRSIFDIAYQLFRRLPPDRLTDKQRSALERAARLCNRLPEVIASYEQLAKGNNAYYGRAKRLRKRLDKESPPKRRKRRSR